MRLNHYLDGAWVDGDGAEHRTSSPWEGRELHTFGVASTDQVGTAAAAARAAQPGWARESPVVRGEMLARMARELDDRSSELATAISSEMGKLEEEAAEEVRRAIGFLTWIGGAAPSLLEGRTLYSESASRQVLTYRRPVGPSLLIVPWNFPANIACWKLGSALASGCSIVLKHSSLTPRSATIIFEAIDATGLPSGVANLVLGPGATGAALTERPEFRSISFTGSTEVGRQLAQAAAGRGQRVQAEMGGVNPVVVMGDAPFDRAVADLVANSFGTSGQRCTAPRLVLVEESGYGRFREAFVAGASETRIAPLASQATVDDCMAGIDAADLPVLVGGQRTGPTTMEPTVLEGLVDEEIFGPVAAIAPIDDLDAALDVIHKLDYGLSSAIYTRSLGATSRFLRETDTGMVHVNKATTGGEAHVPFGGAKASAIGPKEMGAAPEFFTEWVTAYVDSEV